MRYDAKHTIETDVETFWKICFDPEFNRAWVAGIGTYEVLEQHTDEHGVVHRRTSFTPKVAMPPLAKKFLGDGSYTEVGRYDPATHTYVARHVPAVGAEKFSHTIEISTQPLDAKRCQRSVVSEITVNVFGVGRLIEASIQRSQDEAHAKVVGFLNDWIRQNGL